MNEIHRCRVITGIADAIALTLRQERIVFVPLH